MGFGNPPAIPPTGGQYARSATLVVAASDSKDTTNVDYSCDGVADEVEINAAIAALPAAGGSVVLLEGTYTIADTIAINRDNVMLVGAGHGTLIQVSANVNVIEVGDGHSARTNVIIKDLQVDGGFRGIYFHGGTVVGELITRSRVEGCYVHGNLNHGIFLYYSEDCIVARNRVESTASNGIYFYHSNRNQVALNDCDGCGGAGIRIDYSTRNILADNKCSLSDDGIVVSTWSDHNLVVGNYCEDNTANGIEVRGGSDRNIIIGNYCEANVTGIEVSGATSNDNYVVDNYLWLNPLTDTGTETIIDGNRGNVGRYQTTNTWAAYVPEGTAANGTRVVVHNTVSLDHRLYCYSGGGWRYVEVS